MADNVTRINDGDKLEGPSTPVAIEKPNGAGAYVARGNYEVDSFDPSNELSEQIYQDGNGVFSGGTYKKDAPISASIVVQLATSATEIPEKGDRLKYKFSTWYPFWFIVIGVSAPEAAAEETKVTLNIKQVKNTTVKLDHGTGALVSYPVF